MSPKVGIAPVRREQIVKATIRCLARDGATGLRMKRVAAEAGVSQGILHYYFTNKRAMLIAALQTVQADLDHRLRTLLEGTRDSRTRLRAVILALVDGLSLQRTFDAEALTLERAARACEDAVSRYLAKA